MKTTFDSLAEEQAHPFFERLGCIRYDSKFDMVFTDKQGALFYAKPDYYHPASDTYIEYKSKTLNNVTCQESSARALAKQAEYRRGKPSFFDTLLFGWNHSKYKQGVVQKTIGSTNFIVVFRDPILSGEMDAYVKHELCCITLNCLRTYLQFLKLKKMGLGISFTIHEDLRNGFVRFN